MIAMYSYPSALHCATMSCSASRPSLYVVCMCRSPRMSARVTKRGRGPASATSSTPGESAYFRRHVARADVRVTLFLARAQPAPAPAQDLRDVLGRPGRDEQQRAPVFRRADAQIDFVSLAFRDEPAVRAMQNVGEIWKPGGRCDGGRRIGGHPDGDQVARQLFIATNPAGYFNRVEFAIRFPESREDGIQDVSGTAEGQRLLLVGEDVCGAPEGGRDRTLFGDRQLEIGERENALFCQRVDALGVGGSDLGEASKEERTSGQADARFHCPHTSCEVSIARQARGVSCGPASRLRPGPDARARPSPPTGDRRRCTSGTSGRGCSTRRNRAPSRNT